MSLPDQEHPQETAPDLSLARVLRQSERAEELVTESAAELATVNAALKQEIAAHDPQPGVADALKKSEAVETKVEEASEKLTAVNQSLEGEIRDRHLVNHQLAAALEQEEAARHASFHDVLTGLANRALLNDRLEYAIAQARRHDRSLAVMYLDLDKFKSINDTHGHDVGDFVLRAVALRLKASTRGDDTVGRLGGDEFVCLLTEARDAATVERIAEKIINAVKMPLHVDLPGLDLELSVKASIGISLFPDDGTTADVLIVSADKTMYEAKRNAAGYAFAGNRPPVPDVRQRTDASLPWE